MRYFLIIVALLFVSAVPARAQNACAPLGPDMLYNQQIGLPSGASLLLNSRGCGTVASSNDQAWLQTQGWVITVNTNTDVYATPTMDAQIDPGNGSISAGGSVLTTTTSALYCNKHPELIGIAHEFVIAGAGASDGSAPLKTYATGCSGGSKNQYQLAASSLNSSNLSGTMWTAGTDQSSYLATLVAANQNAHIHLPCGGILIDATTIALNQQWLDGCGPISAPNHLSTALTTGTMVVVTTSSTSQAVFTIARSVRMSGLNFVWPDNYGVSANPVVHGPLFTDVSGTTLTGFYLHDISILNAYDVWKQVTTAPFITMWWRNVQGYAIHNVVYMQAVAEGAVLSTVTFNQNTSAGIASSGYGGAGNLQTWSNANSVFFIGYGTGTGGAACSSSHVSLHTSGQLEIYGFNIAFQLQGAHFQESPLSGMDIDVNQLFNVDTGSVISATTVTGSYINISGAVPAIDYEGTCTGQPGHIGISTNTFSPTGGTDVTFMKLNESNLTRLEVTGNKVEGFASAAGASSDLIYLNDTGSMVATFTGNNFVSDTVSANDNGVHIVNVGGSAIFGGNNFYKLYNDFDFTGYTGGDVMIATNTSNTTGNQSVNVPAVAGTTPAGYVGLSILVSPSNNWDIPPSYTYSQLGACGTANQGQIVDYVSDNTGSTFNGSTAGGGSTKTMAFCLSAVWKNR